jgi:RimJ/RimL family protein N-acetyltransferase
MGQERQRPLDLVGDLSGLCKPPMLEDALRCMRADGIRRVELFAESDNAQALRFYQKLGFVHEGTLREFYKRASDSHYVDEYVLGVLLDSGGMPS